MPDNIRASLTALMKRAERAGEAGLSRRASLAGNQLGPPAAAASSHMWDMTAIGAFWPRSDTLLSVSAPDCRGNCAAALNDEEGKVFQAQFLSFNVRSHRQRKVVCLQMAQKLHLTADFG